MHAHACTHTHTQSCFSHPSGEGRPTELFQEGWTGCARRVGGGRQPSNPGVEGSGGEARAPRRHSVLSLWPEAGLRPPLPVTLVVPLLSWASVCSRWGSLGDLGTFMTQNQQLL